MNMPKNKRQHYVPQFYLKLFSNNGKKVFGYNLKTEKDFITSIKEVCNKSYYYDKNGEIERAVSKLEGIASQIIRSVIENKDINHMSLKEWLDLLHFISLQYGRTKVMGDETIGIVNEMFDLIKPKEFENVKLTNKHPALHTMMTSLLSGCLLFDLKHLLLINETKKDFITSDNPVVFFNSFFNDKVDGGTIGFAQTGLQIFYPINSRLLLLLYDSNYYETKKINEFSLKIKKEEDIRRINGLQILHCDNNLFYQNEIMFNDIKLQHRQIGFKRPNDRFELKSVGKRKEEGKNYELIRLSSTKPKCNLSKLSFMKHKKNAPQEIGFRNFQFVKDHQKFIEDFIKNKLGNQNGMAKN